MSQYDLIGKNYSEMIRTDPVKIFVQRPSAVNLLGEVGGKKVLDIGCGDGIISRMVAEQGAIVVGIDPSGKQIMVALGEEKKQPLGIKYFVSEIQSFSFPKKFDSAFAVMVFAYANNSKELQSFFDSVFSLLDKKGKFVIIDWDKNKIPLTREYYGRLCESLPNGKTLINWDIPGVKKYSTEVTYFSKKEFETCARKTGFKKTTFSNLAPTKEGVEKMGEEYWKRFANEPVWFGMTCEK